MRFIISTFCLLFFIGIASEVFSITHIEPGVKQLNEFTLKYFYDNSGQMDIKEISQQNFTQSINNQFTRGYKNGTSWFKLDIINNSHNSRFVLYLTEPFWEQFNLYQWQKGGWLEHKNGLSVPLQQRDFQDTHPAFSVLIPSQSQQTFYLQGRSVSAHLGKLILFTEREYLCPSRITLNDVYLFYHGGLLLVVILNIFLFVAMRERIYAWYIAYIVSFMAFISVLSGSYLLLNIPPWGDALHVVGTLVVMFMALFSGEFLALKKQKPVMYRVFILFAAIFFLFAIMISLQIPYSSLLFNIVSSIFFAILLTVAVRVWQQGYIRAKYYLIALMVYMPSMALMTMVFNGFIDNTDFSRYAFIGGSFIEIVFFSLLLVHRFYELQQEKLNIQTQLLVEKEKTKQNLELEISKRTEQLTASNKKLTFQTKELEQVKKELTLLAITDPLTQLYNRRYFSDIANNSFFHALRYKQPLSIIMLDIDEFKKINDTYGHSAGDRVIVSCARILEVCSRQSDTVARYGGEEFIILVPQVLPDELMSLAKRIKSKISEQVITLDNDRTIQFTLSIGIAQIIHNSDTDIENIINRADQALYAAKQAGKNRIKINTS